MSHNEVNLSQGLLPHINGSIQECQASDINIHSEDEMVDSLVTMIKGAEKEVFLGFYKYNFNSVAGKKLVAALKALKDKAENEKKK